MIKSGHTKHGKRSQLIVIMNTSVVNKEIVDFLSRITGQKLNKKDVTPPVIFLASLVTVLLGVIFVDGTVAEEEKKRLLITLYRFSTPSTEYYRRKNQDFGNR